MTDIEFINGVKKFEQDHKNIFNSIADYCDAIMEESDVTRTQGEENQKSGRTLIKLNISDDAESTKNFKKFLNQFTETERRYMLYIVLLEIIEDIDEEYILDVFYKYLASILENLEMDNAYHRDIIKLAQNIDVSDEIMLVFFFSVVSAYDVITILEQSFIGKEQ